MALLPPLPTGIAPGSFFWNDWYEKMRQLVNNIASSYSWTNIVGKPTTIAGYGITDAYTKTQVDSHVWDWSSITTGKPTTLSGYGITDGQVTTQKDAASGYAGLNASSRTTKGVDTTDDLITDSTAKGPVMKSPNGHYWRATISNAGVITWTDLGTTKP